MASLQLSYDELPARLKQCLLCFSINPEDYEIRAEQLIHWWIGEGLIQGKSSKSAYEIGCEYLSELIKRCLVEVVKQSFLICINLVCLLLLFLLLIGTDLAKY
ncbi:hypothetical protein F8388_021368 [Cannabis sativa]|uniref:Disease resistance protein winged helix domain-containing protein n=1 Tax=Cannabis sativa TaxID=3483 RepID=A0A7J6FDI1_CANSA|nr:hypothetical protein F8388_021368 [Cannabis sativa]